MQKESFNVFFVFRLLIGALLVASGFQKVIIPYQNFLLTIQTYEFLPSSIETLVAICVPWVELVVGAFVCLGLWFNITIRVALGLFVGFVLIIAQALIRNIDIGECGCFGEAFSVPPEVMITIDVLIVAILILLIRNIKRSKFWALDNILG